MPNGKFMMIHLIVRLIKKSIFIKKIEFELDLSNYATKSDLKNATGVDTSDFTKITDIASLKSDIDKLNINKLENFKVV